jgi:hypothetical protein
LFRITYPQHALGERLKPEIHLVDATGVVREFPLDNRVVDRQKEFWAKL